SNATKTRSCSKMSRKHQLPPSTSRKERPPLRPQRLKPQVNPLRRPRIIPRPSRRPSHKRWQRHQHHPPHQLAAPLLQMLLTCHLPKQKQQWFCSLSRTRFARTKSITRIRSKGSPTVPPPAVTSC